MPDLDHAAVSGWLLARDPEAAALARLGPVDADERALAALLRLGVALDKAAERDATVLVDALCEPETSARLRSVLAQIGTARRLRLLEWLGEAGLPNGRALVAAMGNGPDGAFQRAELAVLRRRAVLARVFAPGRIAELRAACAEAGA